MDILPLPQDPAFSTPETPFLSSEDWDLGPFRTYLDRKYQDLGLEEAPLLPIDHTLLTLSLQRVFDGIPASKLQGFLQSWLYFGLLAEFLGLNELEDGNRLVGRDQAREEMNALYRECSKEDEGAKLLTGITMLSKFAIFKEPEGGDVEQQMITVGWCRSEIEKLRNLFQSIVSLHYATRLRPQTRPSDHLTCTTYACRAFQIDISQYKPRHAASNCECEDVHINETELGQILRCTDSYPMLKVDTGTEGTGLAGITMETYEPGMNYIALSHVWADGLGNPRENALPRCQVIKVANSVATLDRNLNESKDARSEYRLWIDTLCCPVEPAGKAIALERISNVYRNATHVLVLDSSLTSLDTVTCDRAEMLLRTFSCSAWMRRLWTLQEAILPQSLCIQFRDKAASASDLMRDLYLSSTKDIRQLRIWHDIQTEFSSLQSLESTAKRLENMFQAPELPALQRAIHFRTVSVQSDEPLCIAVLMSLQIEGLTSITDGEQRMARVWAALSERMGGISTRLVFFLEETLSMKGWKWAPKSLLGSLGDDSNLGMYDRSLRFAVSKPVTPFSLGMPTAKGLRMRAKGGYLTVNPLRENFELQPWKNVAKNVIEVYVLIYREATGDWYRLADWHRSRKLEIWSDEQRISYDRKHPSPLFDCIRSNQAAITFNDFDANAESAIGVLGKAQPSEDDGDQGQAAVLFERDRTVMCFRLPPNEVALLNKVIAISNKLADDQATRDLLACGSENSPRRDDCLAKVRAWLKTTVDQAWREDAEFAQLVTATMGPDMEGSTWATILIDHSNFIVKDSSEDQVWFVD